MVLRKCEICGSTHRVNKNQKTEQLLCGKHSTQISKYGYIKERTQRDKNEIIKYDDYAEVVLYDKTSQEIGRALIDLDDIKEVSKHKWCLMNVGYVATNIQGKMILLHRFIMNPSKYIVVDHIKHNPLDNRKHKLKLCTQQENMCNQQQRSNNTSGIQGVWYDKRRDNWVAEIYYNGTKHYLGASREFDCAVQLRKEAEIKYFNNKEEEK